MPEPVAVSSDGRQAVVASPYETVLYDLESRRRLHAWDEPFLSAQFSRDGRFLLVVRHDDVAVWDAQACRDVRGFTGREPDRDDPRYRAYGHTLAAIGADGSRVAIANYRGWFHRDWSDAVFVYDVSSGQLRQTLVMPEVVGIDSVAFLPGGNGLLVGYRVRRPDPGSRPQDSK